MNKYVAAYAGTAIVMVALDMLWLGVHRQAAVSAGHRPPVGRKI